MSHVNRPTRSITSLAAGAGLLLSTAAVVLASSHTASSAPPGGDCATPFPVAELESGDAVTGLTVAKGTTPAGFTGEVLGVVEDGIAPGLDMVMVDLTSPDIDRVKSIWQGMSGSPVYAADGRLIGAVAYGLSYGPSQIAGVTPFEKMDDYLGAASRSTVTLDRADARAVARSAGVTQAQAARGFKRLSVPMAVSGINPARIDKVARREYLRTPLAGASSGAAVGAETIVAGGNLGASVSYGTVNYAGVGTATSVCDGEVVGFGHPLAYLGATTAALHPASAVYVQPDPVGAAFKVANLGAPVGSITDDRYAGISGAFGAAPKGTVISARSVFGSRSFAGTSTVTVPLFTGEVAWYHLATVNDRAVDGMTKGNALVSWSIKGKDAKGKAYELKHTDRYLGSYDVTSEGVGELPDLVWSLSELDGVTVDSVTSDSKIVTDAKRLKVSEVHRKVKGKWVNITGDLTLKAGSKVTLRAALSGKGTPVYRTMTLTVPKKLKGKKAPLWVRGGYDHAGQGGWGSLPGLKTYVATKVRNDQVVAQLGNAPEGKAAPAQAVSPATSNVVTGQKRIRVIIK
ncbi:hypothetical protein [Nocardioides daphniae]|uniref:Peptidase S55 domain-containing protein n=1 Tax=Nocardioides daphniae TaxID=402297 RepID=A0ABQ1QHK5_9ACTN|nr:hypothetical protein [Nocardioides daphniae]GGD25222.1 hypothetical protein GCM10007231_25670 [Nocardioides daphniae]